MGAAVSYLSCVAHVAGIEPAAYARVIGLAEGCDPSEWVSMAEVIDGHSRVTAVISWQEGYQTWAARIADRLGVAWHSEALVVLADSKPAMRRHLHRAEIDTTPFAEVSDPAGVLAFGEARGWPVVVKPVSGTGSAGVTRVDDARGVRAAFEWAVEASVPWDGTVLVDTFMEGRQFSVETFSEDGDHEVVCVSEKYAEPPHMIGTGHSLPANLEDEQVTAVSVYVRSVLDALGVRDGPGFTELALTADGPRLFETHVRPAGDNTMPMLETALGVDLISLCVRQAVGQRVLPGLRARLANRSRSGKVAAIWYTSPDVDGVLDGVLGEQEARSVPGVTHVESVLLPGARTYALCSAEQRGAFVRAEHAVAEAAVDAARRGAAKLSFLVRAAE